MTTRISQNPVTEEFSVARNYCTICDDYGHAAKDHKDIRHALFDYMTLLQMEEQFEEVDNG